MGSTNVENIESSMKNCSLSSNDQSLQMQPPPDQTMAEVPVPVPEAPDQNTGEVPVEQKLPRKWSEYNDLRTGEKYYYNWISNLRTSVDPRISEAEAEKAGYYLTDDDRWSEYSDLEEIPEGDSILDNSTGAEEGTTYLVAAGCGTCYKYYMVPNNDVDCSRCGSPLIHMPRSGSV